MIFQMNNVNFISDDAHIRPMSKNHIRVICTSVNSSTLEDDVNNCRLLLTRQNLVLTAHKRKEEEKKSNKW